MVEQADDSNAGKLCLKIQISEYNEAKNSRFSEKMSTQSHHVKKKKAHNTESVKMMT